MNYSVRTSSQAFFLFLFLKNVALQTICYLMHIKIVLFKMFAVSCPAGLYCTDFSFQGGTP